MECKECESIFQAKTTRNIFCTKECSNQYHNKNRKKYSMKCKNCDINFETKHKTQIYCSLKCSNSIGNNIYDSEKYREMGKKGAAKKNEGKILLKNTIRICLYCKKDYNPKRSEQKYCNRVCSGTHHIILMKNGTIKMNTNNRGLAEIYFSELCIKHFGENDILCNEKIFKDKNGGCWDSDIVIKSLKLAVLYDGIFHHIQVKKDHKLKQIQSRDKLKRKIILDNGYTYYTIIDKGKFNKKFVQEQFDLFIHKLNFKNVLNLIL